MERLLLVGAVLLVMIVELLNTAVEVVVDRIGAERHHLAGFAKDLGSSAVLLSRVLATTTRCSRVVLPLRDKRRSPSPERGAQNAVRHASLGTSMGRHRNVLAAVDLGSNSFHMVVARRADGQLVIIDRLREMVRLGEGLGPDGRLDAKVAARALACLERFGQRLLHMRANCVRVVGTSALRRARRSDVFLEKARKAIGHPIEVISGREEARLIYSGVVRTLPRIPGHRLVVDIGGGSTELIIGRGSQPVELESLKLGCVTVSTDHFVDGKLSAGRFERARLTARQQIEPIRRAFRHRGWDSVAGSSGTVRALFEALRELDPHRTAITGEGLDELIGSFVAAGHVSRLPFATLGPDRRPVIAGGLAILAEVVSELRIRHMHVADGAMREGVLYDLVGRLTSGDAREGTVRSMQARYHVDRTQAARVERTALALLRQARSRWQLADPSTARVLRWAAGLHEIGLDVAHSGYHRHGAYLLENADMPGFPREEQLLLARLVRAHRRRLDLGELDGLDPGSRRMAERLIVLLRLAVLLHRNRGDANPPAFVLVPGRHGLTMRFRLSSLRRHPLTEADLRHEQVHLAAQGIALRIVMAGRG
ncbi:MAG TPA: diacylglycerol kinase [Steroidobacteraceae bacterium]|nr:diacylglycerol kinase [Steroidobacteraceae bacterium]